MFTQCVQVMHAHTLDLMISEFGQEHPPYAFILIFIASYCCVHADLEQWNGNENWIVVIMLTVCDMELITWHACIQCPYYYTIGPVILLLYDSYQNTCSYCNNND